MQNRVSRLLGLGLLILASPVMAEWTWTPETGRLVNLNRMPKETPELQVEYARTLMVGKHYTQAFEETNKFIKFYPETDWSDDNQKVRGDIRLAEESYMKAADEYQLVITGYPSSDLYDSVIQQQYKVGDTLFAKGQKRAERVDEASSWNLYRKWGFFKHRPLKRAIDVYTMVIDNQPFTDTAAEAQYKVGLCHYTRGEYLESAFEYRRVLEDYGHSEWVQEALYGLTLAYHKVARLPDYDQAPSQLGIDTIAQFKRQYPQDSRGKEMEATSAELLGRIAQQELQTARHYEKRGKKLAAYRGYEGVANQYGSTPAAEKARAWLAVHPKDNKAFPAFLRTASVKG